MTVIKSSIILDRLCFVRVWNGKDGAWATPKVEGTTLLCCINNRKDISFRLL